MKLLSFFLLGLFFGILATRLSQRISERVPASTSLPCAHSADAFRCVEYVSNYDGDTIKFNIPETHPLFGKEISVRVNGIDTAEKRGKLPCEKKAAAKAQNRVHTLLTQSKKIDLTHIEKDKYFRILAEVEIDGRPLSKMLLNENLAYAYDGGTKEKTNWCQRLKLSPE